MKPVSAEILGDWVQAQCQKAPADDPVATFRLKHTRVVGGSARKIDEWTPPADNDFAALGRAIMFAASTDTETFTSPQTYVLAAYRRSDALEPATKSFRLQPNGSDDHTNVSPTEPPTGEGVVSQWMRHMEAKERLHVQSTQGAQSALLKTIEAQQAIIDALTGNAAATIDARERLMLERVSIQSDVLAQQAAGEVGPDIKMMLLKQLEALLPQFLPTLAMRLIEGKKQPEPTQADATSLAKIIEELPEEERTKLFSTFGSKMLGTGKKRSKKANGHESEDEPPKVAIEIAATPVAEGEDARPEQKPADPAPANPDQPT